MTERDYSVASAQLELLKARQHINVLRVQRSSLADDVESLRTEYEILASQLSEEQKSCDALKLETSVLRKELQVAAAGLFDANKEIALVARYAHSVIDRANSTCKEEYQGQEHDRTCSEVREIVSTIPIKTPEYLLENVQATQGANDYLFASTSDSGIAFIDADKGKEQSDKMNTLMSCGHKLETYVVNHVAVQNLKAVIPKRDSSFRTYDEKPVCAEYGTSSKGTRSIIAKTLDSRDEGMTYAMGSKKAVLGGNNSLVVMVSANESTNTKERIWPCENSSIQAQGATPLVTGRLSNVAKADDVNERKPIEETKKKRRLLGQVVVSGSESVPM